MIAILAAAALKLCVGQYYCPCDAPPDYLRVLNPITLQIETTTTDLNKARCQAMKDTAAYDPDRNLGLRRMLKEMRRNSNLQRRLQRQAQREKHHE